MKLNLKITDLRIRYRERTPLLSEYFATESLPDSYHIVVRSISDGSTFYKRQSAVCRSKNALSGRRRLTFRCLEYPRRQLRLAVGLRVYGPVRMDFQSNSAFGMPHQLQRLKENQSLKCRANGSQSPLDRLSYRFRDGFFSAIGCQVGSRCFDGTQHRANAPSPGISSKARRLAIYPKIVSPSAS